jgi:hypothetical protein
VTKAVSTLAVCGTERCGAAFMEIGLLFPCIVTFSCTAPSHASNSKYGNVALELGKVVRMQPEVGRQGLAEKRQGLFGTDGVETTAQNPTHLRSCLFLAEQLTGSTMGLYCVGKKKQTTQMVMESLFYFIFFVYTLTLRLKMMVTSLFLLFLMFCVRSFV